MKSLSAAIVLEALYQVSLPAITLRATVGKPIDPRRELLHQVEVKRAGWPWSRKPPTLEDFVLYHAQEATR